MIAGTGTAAERPGRLRDSLAFRAAGAFLIARAVLFVVLWSAPGRLGARLSTWDGQYYLRLAEHGYPHTFDPAARVASEIAFFPVYPMAIRLVEAATGLSFVASGVVVSLAAGAAAAALIACVVRFVLVREQADSDASRVALIAAALWSVEPASFVTGMVYSESLFTLLVVACLWFALHERWWLAVALALVAGCSRATAVALVAALLALAIMRALTAERPQARPRPALMLRRALPPVAAAVAASMGFAGYLLWVGRRVGTTDAWFVAERKGWKVYTDGGLYTVRKTAQYLLHPLARPSGLAVILVLVAAVALLGVYLVGRPDPLLAVYTTAVVALVVTTHGAFGSMPRLLLPAFALTVPLARWAAARSTALLVAAFGVGALVSAFAAVWVTGQTVLPP